MVVDHIEFIRDRARQCAGLGPGEVLTEERRRKELAQIDRSATEVLSDTIYGGHIREGKEIVTHQVAEERYEKLHSER